MLCWSYYLNYNNKQKCILLYLYYTYFFKTWETKSNSTCKHGLLFLSSPHLSGGTSQKRGRGGQEEGWWRCQEEESAVWHGSELWRLPGKGQTAVEIMLALRRRRRWHRGRLWTVCVLFQAESRRGKRLTGREIKRKTLAERRQPLGTDNLREDALKWVSPNVCQTDNQWCETNAGAINWITRWKGDWTN